MARSYVRGRHNRACCALLDKLRLAGLVGISVGHHKGVLLVYVDDPEKDGPRVPKEFADYTTEVHQCPFAHVPRLHKKIKNGCAHSRWEIMQFNQHGIVPNIGCSEPASQGALSLASPVTERQGQ